ncbi:hypothetical protein RhiirA1_402470 [Rhizophagus irregularis]|uniref:Uncharacterized protein n=1 Tax=Rhizophagus irregularis TaxID=588596 RepID=A0A2N0QY89_9GLOM|nr:hypothetical protein RhiirA1_402470 [Rhizophagus irregularis]
MKKNIEECRRKYKKKGSRLQQVKKKYFFFYKFQTPFRTTSGLSWMLFQTSFFVCHFRLISDLLDAILNRYLGKFWVFANFWKSISLRDIGFSSWILTYQFYILKCWIASVFLGEFQNIHPMYEILISNFEL